MYTGITQGCFPIINVKQQSDHLQYQVKIPQQLANNLRIGASIAIDGVCQTLVEQQPDPTSPDNVILTFNAITETLHKTTLRGLQPRQLVSIERSMCFGDEVGGHLLSGHVHGTGTITDITNTTLQYSMTIQVPSTWLAYIFPKGFIAVNGSSLTVVDVDPTESTFSIHLIPETQRQTRLANYHIGDHVNIELDQQTRTIVDTVKRILSEGNRSVPIEKCNHK